MESVCPEKKHGLNYSLFPKGETALGMHMQEDWGSGILLCF